MSNPGPLIEFKGQARLMSDWARTFGLKPVTLRARLRRGLSMEESLTPNMLNKGSATWYPKVGVGNQLAAYEHREIAKRALGRPLPPGAEVHHVDENFRNNAPDNLVICPNHAYHRLLHLRAKALAESGNPNNRKCVFCKRWDAIENLTITSQNSAQHRLCYNAYTVNKRKQKLTT